MKLFELLREAEDKYGDDFYTKNSLRDILSYICGKSRFNLNFILQNEADQTTVSSFREKSEMLFHGFPIAYLTGFVNFMGVKIELEEGILIPRPDTEVLVLESLKEIKKLPEASNPCKKIKVFEACTGSGCVSIALLNEWRIFYEGCPAASLEITASDINSKALNFAEKNYCSFKKAFPTLKSKINFLKCDLFPEKNLASKFDFLLANPPYISKDEYENLESSVKDHEDRTALYGGVDGLDFYSRIAGEAENILKDGALILLEHGNKQAKDVRLIFQNAGIYDFVRCEKDLGGRDRVSVFRFKSENTEK